jgi:hypothetical protein
MTRFIRIPASRIFIPEGHASQPQEARVFLLFTTDPGVDALTLDESLARETSRYAFLPLLTAAPDWITLGSHLLSEIASHDSPRLSWFTADRDFVNGLRIGVHRPARRPLGNLDGMSFRNFRR